MLIKYVTWCWAEVLNKTCICLGDMATVNMSFNFLCIIPTDTRYTEEIKLILYKHEKGVLSDADFKLFIVLQLQQLQNWMKDNT
jgi:hypothetical protein